MLGQGGACGQVKEGISNGSYIVAGNLCNRLVDPKLLTQCAKSEVIFLSGSFPEMLPPWFVFKTGDKLIKCY